MLIPLKKGGGKMSALKIDITPEVKGKYVKEIIEEIKRKPSPEAIIRNENAYKLLLRLRKS